MCQLHGSETSISYPSLLTLYRIDDESSQGTAGKSKYKKATMVHIHSNNHSSVQHGCVEYYK